MLKNYLKTALRNLLRHKTFSLINILGLSGGLTCCLLIFTFVQDELSYDQFHSKRDRIYRVQYLISTFNIGRIPPVMAEHIASYFPEVETTARFFGRSASVQLSGNTNPEKYEEPNVYFADSSILKIFTFEPIRGSLEKALTKPYTVILNEEIARKYFGEADPIGQSIILEGNHSFLVEAVVKDFPANSHIHFDMIAPYDNMYDLEPEHLGNGIRENFKLNWMVSHSFTYVLLKPGTSPAAVNARFPDFIKEKIPEGMQKEQTFLLQPLADIHLNPDVQAQAEAPGSMTFIYTFIAIGALTLLIACINFINLSTARSLQRTREIGVRKVMGAWKSSLIAQFLGESFVTTFFASVLAMGFTVLLLPSMNTLTNKELVPEVLLTWPVVAGFAGLFVLTSLLAGLYPAFFVTKISPIYSLKGMLSPHIRGGLSFRKVLVVAQFSISMILITCTLIVFDQLDMMRNMPLGFQKEYVINVPLQSANFNNVFGGVDAQKRQKMDAFEESLQQIPGVIASTASGMVPGFGMVNRNVIPEGFTAQDNVLAPVAPVDYDFLETYGIQLLAGRTFSKSYGTDHENAYIINAFAAAQFKFGTPEEALGKQINMEGKQGKVVGVVSDFNFLTLSEPMAPLIMHVAANQFTVFSIRIHEKNIPATLEAIEAQWNQFFPEQTFAHTFLSEQLSQNYTAQEQLGTLIGYFAILAILISCLGSYGLIMFVASQKTKEVGIRKVLGASVAHLVMLLSSRFALLAILGLVISVPATLWMANDWLSDFSYRITISPISFLLAAAVVMGLVLITISIQALRAAMANPVKSLRTE